MKIKLLVGVMLLSELACFAQGNNSINSSTFSSVFTKISESMNVYGAYISNAKPLQYNRHVNAYSFIQRKSPTYVTNPALNSNAESGAIVMYLGKNEGANWDSTLIYADNNNWGRYPTGGLFLPPNATSISQAYAIGSGACASSANLWVGSWRASKLIGSVGTNSVGSDVQFFANSGTFSTTTSPNMTKHYNPGQGFTATDDGAVRVIGILNTDPNASTYNLSVFRGAHISKGTFNSGAMVWTSDSIVPQFIQRTDGSNQANTHNVYMAWNDQGNIGYVMMIGARSGSTLRNKSWQPVIYKTTNSGNTWAIIPGIDFNSSNNTYDKLLNSMGSINNSTVVAPYFKTEEGIDITVDKNGKLHIVGLAVGCSSADIDSLDYTWQYTVTGQPSSEKYSWNYSNNKWPYLCDFSGDGTGLWEMAIVDSLGTEVPGKFFGYPGFNSNPWASATNTNTINSDARIQVSRSYDGEFIVYSWTESDTVITSGFLKWNQYPNIHQRARRICDGSISSDEYVVTSPPTGSNPKVKDKAYFHYMGSSSKVEGSTSTQATFTVPYTVTSNPSCVSNDPVSNYFSKAIVTHNFPNNACGATVTTDLRSKEIELSKCRIYPNPAINDFNVAINLSQTQEISIKVYNAIGQLIISTNSIGYIGENTTTIPLNKFTPGFYLVKTKSGNYENTQKLIVE